MDKPKTAAAQHEAELEAEIGLELARIEIATKAQIVTCLIETLGKDGKLGVVWMEDQSVGSLALADRLASFANAVVDGLGGK